MPKPSEYIQKGWCQHVNAKDRKGEVCGPFDPMAERWCLVGALHAAYSEDTMLRERATSRLFKAIAKESGGFEGYTLAAWNDTIKRTQAEVVALLQSIGE